MIHESDADRFVRAIRMTESNENPAAVGDAGRAWTSIQCHPPWLWQWSTKLDVSPLLGETWDEWTCRVLRAYALYHVYFEPAELAMYYHVGHAAVPGEATYDAEYAARFARNWALAEPILTEPKPQQKKTDDPA